MLFISEKKRFYITVIVHFVLWTGLALFICKWVLLPTVRLGSTFGITLTPTEPGSSSMDLTIIDFASHFNFAKKTWQGQTTVNSGSSVYSLENHLKVTRDWAGIKLNHALPFGYSPTMLWVLAPLLLFSPITAYCLFYIVGLLSVWWQTHPFRCRRGVGLLAFFSLLSQACFGLGQTALITGAGLLFIAEKTREKYRDDGWRIHIFVGIALWALTAKPPLALTAVAALLGLRKWRPLFVTGMLSIFFTLAITPLLGTNWINDYIHMIGSYDKINANVAFAWSIVPNQMANLRGVLSFDFGVADNVASRVSTIMWFIALLCIAAIHNRPRLSEGAIWSLSILSYLIFCPHVSSTEELQLVLILPLCVRPENKLNWQELVLLGIIPLLPFSSPAIGLFSGNRMVLFIAKISMIILILVSMKRTAINTSDR
jgi:hypothetical protein